MKTQLQDTEAIKKMKEMVESINICMYTTLDPISTMTSRPMGCAQVEDDGSLWFFTDDHTTAGDEASINKEVCLNFSSPAKNSYISITGQSELSRDKARMEKYFNDFMKTWFPKGLETPGIALIKVTPETANFWDADASRMSLLFSYLKAKITGEAQKADDGEMGEMKFK